MRINLQSLDPASPLTRRIQDALARDAAARATVSPAGQSNGTNSQAPPGAHGETWHREDDLHRAIVGMIAAEAKPGVIAFHVPNGGKRSIGEARKFAGLGVLAGVPDLVLLFNGRAFGLEIKTDKGTLSKAQKLMAERFRRAGCDYEVARSIARARQLLRQWGAIEAEKDTAA